MALLHFNISKEWYQKDRKISVKAGDVYDVADPFVYDALIKKGYAVPHKKCCGPQKACTEKPQTVNEEVTPVIEEGESKRRGRMPQREKKVVEVEEIKESQNVGV